jgi:protein Tob/BTG
MMITEIQAAVNFICTVMKRHVEASKLENFRKALTAALLVRYEEHWFPAKPFKGSGYRCIQIARGQLDKNLSTAGETCSMKNEDLLSALPKELTLWVDPNEVSYRFGDEGSIGVLYSSSTTDNFDSGISSDSSSTCSSVESDDMVSTYSPYQQKPKSHNNFQEYLVAQCIPTYA